MIAGLGFADDAALLTAVIGLVASHINPPTGPPLRARWTRSCRASARTHRQTHEPRWFGWQDLGSFACLGRVVADDDGGDDRENLVARHTDAS